MTLDLRGRLQFHHCFTVRLEQQHDSYLAYRFSDFISDYTRQKSDTCTECISRHKRLTFPVEGRSVDRSAADKKHCGDDNLIDERGYYYCPLIGITLDSSSLRAQLSYLRSPYPVEPIHTILDGKWDDDYFFDFLSIQAPKEPFLCAIYENLFSPKFTSTPSERSFLKLWFLAVHLQMDRLRGRRDIFLEEADLLQITSKLFQFLLPIPQVWVTILPAPAPREYPASAAVDAPQPGPQRVDFLLTYKGRLHVIEIDGRTHYGAKGNSSQASEPQYRKTLMDTRALEQEGCIVHRFTNEEILQLDNGSPNAAGFIDLLRTAGLDLEEMVFIGSVGEPDTAA